METNRNKVVEINLKDLLLFVLKKIWIIILVGAILGSALGVRKFVQRVKTNDVLDITRKLSSDESDVEYKLRAQNIDRARVITEMVSGLNSRIDSEKQYIADSVLMKIDPNNEYKSSVQMVLNIDSNKLGTEKTLFRAYYSDIMTGQYLSEYAESIGTKPEYILELIYIDYDSIERNVFSSDSNINSVPSMYISIIGPSEDFCDKVMSLIVEELNLINQELLVSIAPHTINFIEKNQVVVIDDSTRTRQLGHTETIQAIQNQIATYYDLLGKVANDLGISDYKEVLEYFDVHSIVELDGIPTETSEKEESRLKMLMPGIKLSLIGFCAGAAFVVLVYVLKYLLSSKIITQAQFFGCFSQIPCIGVLKPLGKRSKFCNSIDILSEDDTDLSDENYRKLIAANYYNITSGYSKVLITGTGDSKVMRASFDSLAINGDLKPDIFSNPDVLKGISDYDCVVLLEQRNKSLYKKIDKEICLIGNSNTPVVGAIII